MKHKNIIIAGLIGFALGIATVKGHSYLKGKKAAKEIADKADEKKVVPDGPLSNENEVAV